MRTKILYFVHGTTYDNAAEKCSGWKNVELNELGIQQAKNLREQANNPCFDVLFTSDLKRSIDSAEFAWPEFEKIQDARLKECNYGDFDGESKDLVIYENYIDKPFPNGESLKDVEKRISDFINDIKQEYTGKRIAIIAHRAPQLAFEVLTKDITWEEAIENDWRKTKSWQPGWEYYLD